jgi:hypothetical protein
MSQNYYERVKALPGILHLKLLKFRKILADIVKAIKGSEQDYTNIRLGRAIFLLAVPMVWKWQWNRCLPL